MVMVDALGPCGGGREQGCDSHHCSQGCCDGAGHHCLVR